jgi:hypothetical protein
VHTTQLGPGARAPPLQVRQALAKGVKLIDFASLKTVLLAAADDMAAALAQARAVDPKDLVYMPHSETPPSSPDSQ